ncbi:MAG: cysteine--tRNA ligase, partial [Candidatus Gastranaerophilales bacterium]|nr:cysteine--tRNA ligase [Candidatus Gastranaerophilales bacterium]
MKIYDSYSKELKEFKPLDENKVKMYVCGPTVYDFAHLGHARCYITWDMVSRYLRFKGYDVTYVRNVTDVDDKIIAKAKEENTSVKQVSDKFHKEFIDSMSLLNVLPPDIEPKATKTIDEMISIIKILVDKGFAYPANGDVYFRVDMFKDYGNLSHQTIKDLESGARVENSDKKENPLDFALWKAVKDEKEIGWNSPWGNGRPGWHIECSAMAKKYLGETIDIHAGGQDLLFPHHENEIAQSECSSGKKFVKY